MSDSSSCDARLNRSQTLTYGVPALALAVPTIPAFVLLPPFYAEDLGLGLATVGICLLFVRLFDVVSDPVLGWVSDRLPVKSGRRKWPMAVGAVLAGPALLALFSPPETVSPGYLVGWGGLLFLGWTAVQIPYLAWAAELEPGYQARSRLTASREGFGLLGIVGAGIVIALLAERGVRMQFQLLAWVTVVVGGAALCVALRRLPDVGRRHAKISTGGLSLLRNRLFGRLLAAWFVNGLANGFPAVCFVLFVQHVLQAEEAARGVFLLVYFAAAIAAIPLWLRLAERFGKHRVWCGSMLLASIVFSFAWILGPGDHWLYAAICLVTGACLGADLVLPPSIQADVADWDRLRFRADRTALLFSFWNMAVKLALALAVGIAYPLLDFAGLGDDPAAVAVLVVIYALIPIVLKLIAVLMMWRFPIAGRQQVAIRKRLTARAAAE